jgi:hypothetical protein
MSHPLCRPYTRPLKLFVGTAAAALLIGWAAGVGAQTTNESLPPQQAWLPASGPTANLPSLPLGHDDVREVQNQLIALGFEPGPADGQAGPATIAAAQQYDQSRGGSGRVSIDGALLARLKQDTGPRLTYEQVAARSQARQQAQTSASAPASNQFGNVVQQIAPLLGAMISNSNNNNNGGYGPGYYGPGPGYYGPGPGYYGHGYGY